ncbi:hypothetical protein [Streptomyces humi]|uniref:hypothetical protein n=1 Tax=Streptomyces humi TaxID=1428620 RepID=UPI0030B843D3
MTTRDAVRVRAQGEVDEEVLGFVRSKVDAAFDRLGLPPAQGTLTVVRAAAQHVQRPWSATARLQAAGTVVVVHAEEATAHELAGRLEDRVRASGGGRAPGGHGPPVGRTATVARRTHGTGPEHPVRHVGPIGPGRGTKSTCPGARTGT